MSTRAIIFIGSNPSNASPSDCAFDPSVRSTKTLLTWISDIEAKFMFMNVSDIKTKNNKQLSMAEIKRSLPLLKEKLDAHPDAKLVALGRTAEKALKLLNRNDFLSLPHPSGINRKLNNHKTICDAVNNLKLFSKGYNIITDAT